PSSSTARLADASAIERPNEVQTSKRNRDQRTRPIGSLLGEKPFPGDRSHCGSGEPVVEHYIAGVLELWGFAQATLSGPAVSSRQSGSPCRQSALRPVGPRHVRDDRGH